MHITQLEIENVKRVSAVTITPDGNAVVIGGKNGAGKSSVLDAIMYALAGGKSLPTVPIRNGEKSGRVEVTLSADGDKPPLKVTRVFSEKGSRLEVRYDDEHRAKLSNPQAILDTLCGRVAFDPLAFARAKPREQAEQLRQLVGVDFAPLDAKRQSAYEARTERNRQAKALQARLDAMPKSEGDEKPVVVAELLKELERARAVNDDAREAREDAANAQSRLNDIDDDIDEIEAKLAQLKEQRKELAKTADNASAEADSADAARIDTAPIVEALANAEAVNERIRQREARAELAVDLAALTDAAEAMTDEIDAVDAKKQQLLAEAAWPVPGLGFDADGVTLNGLPFDQASQAEQLRVSVAMGFAANPNLRVILLRDASLLDADSLALVTAMAEEADGQVWVERVGNGEECTLVIEDGKVI